MEHVHGVEILIKKYGPERVRFFVKLPSYALR